MLFRSAYIQWDATRDALVFRNQQYDLFEFRTHDDSGATMLRLQGSDADVWGSVYAQENSGNHTIGFLDGDNNWAIKHVKDTDTQFLINNVEKMRLTTTGLAIGTTSIGSNKLHVNGGSKYLGGGDWTTLERVTSTEANYALYVQTTGTNNNQAIARFLHSATQGSANTGTATFELNRDHSAIYSKLRIQRDSTNNQLTLKRTGSATGEYDIYTNTNKLYFKSVSANTIPLTLEGTDVAIGTGGSSPDATLDVARGTATSGTAIFRGSNAHSHFNYSTSERTYIRGGKTGSYVTINDTHDGDVILAAGGGQVGISTVSPQRDLDLSTSGQITFGDLVSGTNTSRPGIFWHSTNSYGIYRTSGSWSGPNYQQLQITWHTGIILNPGSGDYGKSHVEIGRAHV